LNPIRRSLATILALLGRLGRRTRAPEQLRVRTLVVAPHPDDEVLGCGGTIAVKAAMACPVRVVIMTDGHASHAKLIEPAPLIAARRAEALSAARALGLAEDAYTFLDLPDHDLRSHRAAAIATMRGIIEQFGPAEIYIPHRRDRLEDHVVTNEIVREAVAGQDRRVLMLEYPVWLRHTWPWTTGRDRGFLGGLRNAVDAMHLTLLCRTGIDVRGVLDRKQAALREYRSQVERRNGDPAWPILADVSGGEWLAGFAGDFETFDEWVHEP
jgi:LmbE family N-acetylglucosaminyl deacetylase